jgi:MFS family permease
VHRLSGASGAGRTGLATLIELTAAAGIGDAFVTIGLAGSLFFSASVEQARGRITIALLVTIVPYMVLAPLIGPLLDRVKQGNRYILLGTLLARGLLCWGMAGAVQYNDVVTLLPAAFGVLILQKVYSVTKSAVTPRLLPPEITLVTANARANLGSLIATSLGAAVAAGVDAIMGGGGGGAGWVLRVGTFVYLAAMVIGLRLPDRVDGALPTGQDQRAAQHGEQVAGAGAAGPGAGKATRPLPVAEGRRGLFAVPRIGPVVGEAMRVNASIRMFYGFMMFFLAFILRSEHFGHISDKIALGGLAVALAAGGVIGTTIGSALRARAPQLMMYLILGLATLVSIGCAMFFGLWSVLLVALVAAISQTLVKVALDSILQREIPEERRSSAFAFSETLHQLALVAGGLLGLALSLTGSGFAGLTVAAGWLALSLCWLVVTRRRRIVRQRVGAASPGPAGHAPPPPATAAHTR